MMLQETGILREDELRGGRVLLQLLILAGGTRRDDE